MDGYLNNRTRILNEWYQIFKNKKNPFKYYTHRHECWEYVKHFILSNTYDALWKDIPLIEFLRYHFIIPNNVDFKPINISRYKKYFLPINAHKIIFINGQFQKKLSDSNINPWILKTSNKFDNYIKNSSIQSKFFSCLTKCLSESIIQIKLPKKSIIQKPLYILYINEDIGKKNQLITIPYYFRVKIENDTNAFIIEHFINKDTSSSFFNNIFTPISIGNRSILQHIKLICENTTNYHVCNYNINLGKETHMQSSIFMISSPRFIHHQTNAKIDHSGSSLSLNSLTFLSKNHIGKVCTYVEHNNKNYASSKQLHKIIACDCSIGFFNGLIKVNKNSIQADGNMINNNLLLDASAEITTHPELEIYSDDVQCSHGATIGQINSDHLFYLNTRGIPVKEALKILIYAFVSEITESIEDILLRKIIIEKIQYTSIRNVI